MPAQCPHPTSPPPRVLKNTKPCSLGRTPGTASSAPEKVRTTAKDRANIPPTQSSNDTARTADRSGRLHSRFDRAAPPIPAGCATHNNSLRRSGLADAIATGDMPSAWRAWHSSHRYGPTCARIRVDNTNARLPNLASLHATNSDTRARPCCRAPCIARPPFERGPAPAPRRSIAAAAAQVLSGHDCNRHPRLASGNG